MPSHHPHTAPAKPMPKQQRYLRELAEQTETSFTPPATKTQASREISRLLELRDALEEHPVSARIALREHERRAVQADLQAGAGDSIRHQPDETRADTAPAPAWRTDGRRSDDRRRPTARARPLPAADGPRAIVAQRIDGRVASSDVPLTGDGRVYLIERHVPSHAELDGLVAAYLEHSQEAGCPAVIAQRRQLDQLIATIT
jgi:hypothetical protein